MSTRLRSPFAFLGRSAASDDDTKDDKNKSKSKAEETDDEDDDKKEKDKDDEDDKDDSKSKSKKGAKSKAEDDDDDEESDTSARSARARERSRIRAILTSEAGQADPVAAAHVALDTAMPRAQAIGMLTAMQVSRGAAAPAASGASRAGLRERMETVPNAQVGADGGKPGGPSMADQIIAAGKKARGEA